MNSWLSPILEKYSNPKRTHVSQSNQPEARLTLKCAKHDRRFSVVARKDANGSWYRVGCEPIDPAGGAKSIAQGNSEGGIDMSWALNGLPCYFCSCAGKTFKGDNEPTVYVRCGKCGEWVCLAWSVGRFFNCSNSCGAVGRISAETASAWGNPAAAKVCGVSIARPGLAQPTALRLGNGGRR